MNRSSGPVRTGLILAVALFCSSDSAAAQGKPGSPLTLATALELANANSPLLRSAELAVSEAGGGLTQAAVLLVDNPEVTARMGQRSGPIGIGTSYTDFEIGLEQRIEIAGQRGRRIGIARAWMQAARAEADDARRVVELAVATSFYEALAADERVSLALENEVLAERLADVAERRLEAGIGTPLEVNAATVRLAEARRLRLRADAERQANLHRLRSYLGIELPETTTLEGTLPESGPPADADVVLAGALANRPDLRASERRVEAAAAQAGLARAESWPDVSLVAAVARDEEAKILTAGLRVPLSLFNRNQGVRAASVAARERATAEREASVLDVSAETRSVVVLYEQAREGVALYDADVVAMMEESAALMQFAAEAGELGIAEVLVVQAELLNGRLGYVDVRLELATAGARLRAAVGASQSIQLDEAVR